MSALLAALAIVLPGAALARQVRCSSGLRVAIAAAFGVAAWSAGYAVALMLGASPLWKDVLFAALGAVALRWKQPAAEPGRSETPRWLVALFVAACAVCAAGIVEHLWRFPGGGWDAWMIWNLRARFFARGGFAQAFSPHILFWAHQDYPLLVPGAVAEGFALFGETQAVPGAFGFFCAALAIALVTLGVAEKRGARIGLAAGLVLATTPCLVPFAANQQADVPLGAFVGLTAVLIALDEPLWAGLAAGFAAWTKNEGLVYFVCFAVALRKPRFLLGALPVLVLLIVFKVHYAHGSDLAAPGTLQRLTDPQRWGQLALELARRVVYFQDFALWIVAELAVLAYFRPRRGVLGTALLLAVASWIPVYVVQPHPLLWFVRASIGRLFIQIWPAAIVATALSLPRATADT